MATHEDRALEVAERVAAALRAHGASTAFIGAAAAAVHNYRRATADLDLASFVQPFTTLTAVKADLEAEGYKVRFDEPDAQDPLGGVLGFKSKNDVAELLLRNPSTALSAISDVCDRYGLGDELRQIVRAIGH